MYFRLGNRLVLGTFIAVSSTAAASTFSYTSPVVGSHMRLAPTGAGEDCWANSINGSGMPVAECAAGEYDVDVWHGGSNGWANHEYKASNTDPVILGGAETLTESSLYSYTSPVVGSHMRLAPTGAGEDCWANSINSAGRPVAECPAGEYDVDVWHGGSNGWANHEYKASNTDPVTLGDTDTPTDSSLYSYISPVEGSHMRLAPTGAGEDCWANSINGAGRPVAECPAGEYDVDVWHGGSNGWANHEYKASNTDPVTLGDGVVDTGTSIVEKNVIPGVDINALSTTSIENLPFFHQETPGSTPYGNASNPDSDFIFTQTTDNTWGVSDTDGNFRIECQWSHFAYDDPIVFHDDSDDAPANSKRGESKAHLHMFWGNTAVDWRTNLIDKGNDNYITKKGGSTCNGLGLNRSSYWMPALMIGESHAIAPREIIVYYKSRTVAGEAGTSDSIGRFSANNEDAVLMPQGLQLITGYGKRPPELEGELTNEDDTFNSGTATPRDKNSIALNRYLNYRHGKWGGVQEGRPGPGERPGENRSNDWWTIDPFVFWGCGLNGHPQKKFNRIPTAGEWRDHCGVFNLNGKAKRAFLSIANDTSKSTAERNAARQSANELRFEAAYPLLEATIYFPQCRPTTGEGVDTLRSHNFRDHVRHAQTHEGCPDGYEHRMPQLGYRVYWDIKTIKDNVGLNVNELRLSSDPLPEDFTECTVTQADHYASADMRDKPFTGENPTVTYRCDNDPSDGEEKVPGGTLHADWVSGWHNDVMKMWVENCNRAGVNCTLGETGTSLSLIRQPGDFIPDDARDYLISTPHGSMRHSM